MSFDLNASYRSPFSQQACMSISPKHLQGPDSCQFAFSYSLEGLSGEAEHIQKASSSLETASLNAKGLQQSPLAGDERGSLVSLTEEEPESEQGGARGPGLQVNLPLWHLGFSYKLDRPCLKDYDYFRKPQKSALGRNSSSAAVLVLLMVICCVAEAKREKN